MLKNQFMCYIIEQWFKIEGKYSWEIIEASDGLLIWTFKLRREKNDGRSQTTRNNS
jgi:hypothetical protein